METTAVLSEANCQPDGERQGTDPEQGDQTARRPFWQGRWSVVVGAVCFALGIAFLLRVDLLQLAAMQLVASDNERIVPADAALVLGGGINTRPFEAALLCRTGVAPQILVANGKPSRVAKFGLVRSGCDITLEMLTAVYGVPDEDIALVGTRGSIRMGNAECGLRNGEARPKTGDRRLEIVRRPNRAATGRQEPGQTGDGKHEETKVERSTFNAQLPTKRAEIGYVTSTFEEAEALRLWCAQTGAKSVILVTNPFHSRRARRIFRKVLGRDIRIQVATINCEKYTPWDWWQSEEGLIAFNNEWIKTVYYWIKY